MDNEKEYEYEKLVGTKINSWTIKSVFYEKFRKNGNYPLFCECECGDSRKATLKEITTTKSCQKCYGIASRNIKSGENNLFKKTKDSAKIRSIEFQITKDFMFDLLKQQNYKCKLTGLDIYVKKYSIGIKEEIEQTASLDRIDSSKGYTEDNVQWIHKDLNWMKSTLPENIFIYYCKKVINNENKTS